ncbi:uncharacterized protein BDR25DRAFT_28195 [Lindgomyces ingoldianus]|uniref:Uncharacterized protein n=1 Tax=Lindgomyces ingoldianus TaxID=673940 RepID=A0ACB6QXV8_9PLEO|nr:uncharacterized protein BDR25DRAFT_28195 [Lindgomyces ingoldianus]KAF2470917.1 hypothetical protein BDR25DRAFT_28195 [Lindgomyces ingoldianus]
MSLFRMLRKHGFRPISPDAGIYARYSCIRYSCIPLSHDHNRPYFHVYLEWSCASLTATLLCQALESRTLHNLRPHHNANMSDARYRCADRITMRPLRYTARSRESRILAFFFSALEYLGPKTLVINSKSNSRILYLLTDPTITSKSLHSSHSLMRGRCQHCVHPILFSMSQHAMIPQHTFTAERMSNIRLS